MGFDTDNNVTSISGSTSADIATTYLNNAHYQNVMVVNSALEQLGTTPFPFYLTSSAGDEITTTGNSVLVTLSGTSTVNSVITGQSFSPLIVAGMAGATAIAITSANFQIRGLTAATDSISVYGVQGATAVGITAGNFQIRGLTAATDSIAVQGVSGGLAVNMLVHGISGSTAMAIGVSMDALKVFLTNSLTIGGEVGVTAYNLHTRYNTFGTPTDPEPGQSYDAMRVAGFSGAYPVGSVLAGLSGGSWNYVGVSGGKLLVDIGPLTLTGGTFGVDVTDITVTNVVSVKGSDTATSALWVAGSTSGGAISVTGGGVSGSIRIEGFATGTAIGITASDFDIRALDDTTDSVDIGGSAYTTLTEIETNTKGLAGSLGGIDTSLTSISSSVSSISTSISNVREVSSGPTQIKVKIDSIAASLSESNLLPVKILDMKQPTTFYNGQVSVLPGLGMALIPSAQTIKSGITVKSSSTNPNPIYIGRSPLFTSNGYELSPGESIFVEIDDIGKLYVVADSEGNTLHYLAT